MSDNIKRADLLKVANLVRPALASQAYIPALTHIQFARGLATTYNDVASISVKTDAALEACVPGELLIKALNSFGGENVAVAEKDNALVLSSGRSKLKLPVLDTKAFPFTVPKDDGDEVALSDQILAGISACLLSVGNDPTHPAQMGITLDVDSKGNAVLFSTDNFTISRYATRTKISLPGDSPVILPTLLCEQIGVLAKAFKDEKPVLVIMPGALLVEFGKQASVFTKTLVDLEPLDFPKIIDKHCKLSAVPDLVEDIPDAFDGALDRALLVLANEVDKVTKITATADEIKLNSSADLGDSDDAMAFAGTDGAAEPFYVDPVLLARGVKATTKMAFLSRAVVLTKGELLHLIAHCSK